MIINICVHKCWLESPETSNHVSITYLDGKYVTRPITIDPNPPNIIYFKLPYLGKSSTQLKSKLSSICSKYNIKSKVRLAFVSFKLNNMLSAKDKHVLKSHVVYRFDCGACNDSYVGYTTRHYTTRIREHLFTDKKSHVYKHIHNNQLCQSSSNESNFSLIDAANTEYQLRIREAIHINWIKPKINKQKFSYKLTLNI